MSRFDVRLIAVLLTALFGLNLFCAHDPVSGNSSETTDAVAYVYKSDGTPAMGAKFAFVKGEGWLENLVSSQSLVVDSGFVSAGGRLDFNRANVEKCNIQIDGETEGTVVYSASDIINTDTLRLKPFRRLEGSVAGTGVERLYLEGTRYESEVVHGQFLFEKVSEGAFTGVAKVGGDNGGYYYTSRIDSGSEVQHLLVRTDRIVYDDFDDGDLNPAVMDALGGSSWFWISSQNAQIYQPVDDSLEQALKQGEHGLCIHTRFGSNGGTDVYRVQVSSFLSTTRMLNLSSLDSVIIYAKGNSELTLALERAPAEEVAVKAGYALAVTDQWTRFAIDPNNVTLSEYDATMLTWDEIKNQVNMITVFAQNGDEFWVDGIEFVGASVHDLIP